MSRIEDKQQVYINSREREYGTDSDFTIKINLKTGNQFDRLTLLAAAIPKSYYNVKDGINYFTLTELGQDVTITMDVGNYNRLSFATQLQSKLRAGSATLGNNWIYTVSVPDQNTEADTGKYTYTVSSNTGQPSFTFDTTTFINELMGFTQSTTQVLTYTFEANTLESDVVCNLQPYQTVNVHCNLVNNEWTTPLNTDVLATIPANVGSVSYANIGYICPDIEAFSVILSTGNTSMATITLKDEDGVTLDTNGVNITLELLFWQKNKAMTLLTQFIKFVTGFISSYYINKESEQSKEILDDNSKS